MSTTPVLPVAPVATRTLTQAELIREFYPDGGPVTGFILITGAAAWQARNPGVDPSVVANALFIALEEEGYLSERGLLTGCCVDAS